MYRSKYNVSMFNFPVNYQLSQRESLNPYQYPRPRWPEARPMDQPPGSIFSKVDYENFRPRSSGYLDLTCPPKYFKRLSRKAGNGFKLSFHFVLYSFERREKKCFLEIHDTIESIERLACVYTF